MTPMPIHLGRFPIFPSVGKAEVEGRLSTLALRADARALIRSRGFAGGSYRILVTVFFEILNKTLGEEESRRHLLPIIPPELGTGSFAIRV